MITSLKNLRSRTEHQSTRPYLDHPRTLFLLLSLFWVLFSYSKKCTSVLGLWSVSRNSKQLKLLIFFPKLSVRNIKKILQNVITPKFFQIRVLIRVGFQILGITGIWRILESIRVCFAFFRKNYFIKRVNII